MLLHWNIFNENDQAFSPNFECMSSFIANIWHAKVFDVVIKKGHKNLVHRFFLSKLYDKRWKFIACGVMALSQPLLQRNRFIRGFFFSIAVNFIRYNNKFTPTKGMHVLHWSFWTWKVINVIKKWYARSREDRLRLRRVKMEIFIIEATKWLLSCRVIEPPNVANGLGVSSSKVTDQLNLFSSLLRSSSPNALTAKHIVRLQTTHFGWCSFRCEKLSSETEIELSYFQTQSTPRVSKKTQLSFKSRN